MKHPILFGVFLAVIVAGTFIVLPLDDANTNNSRNKSESEPNESNYSKIPAEAPETVVLVTVEALRADHTGSCYGHQRNNTPTFCSVADDGVLFETAYAQADNTHMSIPSILTGKLPMKVGLDNFSQGMDTVKTIGDVFRNYGYTILGNGKTGAFPSVWDHQRNWRPSNITYQPTLYWTFYPEPHYPYGVNDTYRKWDNASLDKAELTKLEHLNFSDNWPESILRNISQEDYKALYDADIYKEDTKFAELIAYLKQQDAYNDSMIVITGDHGTGLGEDDRYTHHNALPYEETLKVPMIIKLPGNQHAGTRVSSTVRHVDIVPTILDYTGLNASLETDGISLRNHIEGKENSSTGPIIAGKSRSIHWTIKQNGYKYHLLNTYERCFGKTSNANERLYNLTDETWYESNKTRLFNGEIRKRLRSKLCRMYTTGYNEQSTLSDNDMDKATKNNLERLGYLE